MLASIANGSVADSLLVMGIPVAEKALRVAGVYLGLLVLLRLAGKREVAQLNSFDFVVLLLLSNVVQNAIIGPDNSLWGGLLGAWLLVSGNALVVRSVGRSDRLALLFQGRATTIVEDGRIDIDAVRELGLRRADVVVALRKQGADDIADVQSAALEPGGAVLMHLRPDAMTATRGDVERLEAKLDELLRRAR